MPRPLRRTLLWTVPLVALTAGGGWLAWDALAALAASAPPGPRVAAERAAQPVRVTRVSLQALDAAERYTGTIRPQHEVAMGFRLSGKLVARLVEVGDRVAKGDVLARLDDTDARLEFEAATAELSAARTDLARAEAEVARSRTLHAQGHVAEAALDRATSAAAEAQARADRADRARMLAENRLSYMDLVAPQDGIVTATPAEAGQVVAAAQPIVLLAGTDARDVVFALPEQRRAVLDGARATAELWGTVGRPYDLALRDISPDVDPAGRTYRVRMSIRAADDAAALGRTVTVNLSVPQDAPVVTLPLAAILNDGKGPAVWRLVPGTDRVEQVAVTLVAVEGQVVRLRGGLSPGDLVVSLGAHKIDAARPVRIVETAEQPEG